MKRAISHALFTLAIFFVACSPPTEKSKNEGNKPVVLSDFPSVIDLDEIDSIRTPSMLFSVKRLISTNDYIIALGSSKDTVFRVFNVPTGKYLGGFGYLGPGPLDMEFNQIVPTSVAIYNDALLIGDAKKVRKYTLKVKNNGFDASNLTLERTWKIPGELLPLSSAFTLGDSVIVGHIWFSEKQLVQYNVKSREIKDIVDYPNWHPEIPPTAYSTLYIKALRFSRDGSKAGIAYRYFPRLWAFNLQNSNVVDISFKPKNEQVKNITVGPREMAIHSSPLYGYYLSIEVSDNRIYAYYAENSRKVDEKGESKTLRFNEPELHVFDWSGKPISRIMLPPNVIYYTITPDDRYLYFVKIDTDNYIYRYKL